MDQNQVTNVKLDTLCNKANQLQIIDAGAFKNLISETSEDVVIEILNAFKGTLKETIDQLKKGKDLPAETAYKACHKLKGSALLLGFKPLGDMCIDGMAAAKEGSEQTRVQQLDRILAQTETVNALVHAHI